MPPREYGLGKTLYDCWGEIGVFTRIAAGLAKEAAAPKALMIDATCLKD